MALEIGKAEAAGSESTGGLESARARSWLLPLGAAAVVAVVGFLTSRTMEASLNDEVRATLREALDTNVNALRLWLDAHEAVVAAAVQDPRVIEAAIELVVLGPEQAADSEPLRALRNALNPTVRAQGYAGFGLIDWNGRVVGAGDDLLVGRQMRGLDVMRKVTENSTVITPPFDLGLGAAMFAAGAVRDTSDRIVGALGFRVRPRRFSEILVVGRRGRTGETYAFDGEGRLISESRFEKDLVAQGRLRRGQGSVLNVRLRDDVGGLLPGHGGSGLDLEGYTDYRGRTVVGAWTWLEDYEFGVATKIDREEAFETLAILRRAFRVLFALLALAAVGGFVASRTIYALRRRVREAQRLGPYTLGEQLGVGGMGEVYRAHHRLLRRPTAVKILRPDEATGERIQRFEREVQMTARLQHPNTIEVYDYGRAADGTFYYAMEYLEGIPLGNLVAREGPLPPARVVSILRQVCGSLAEAHAAGLIHRDVKPSNIMLCDYGGIPDTVKVLDFGLVREAGGGRSDVSRAGSIVGTPMYLAPESVRAEDGIDGRVDLYALGAVAYYLVCGEQVFPGESMLEVVNRHLHEEPAPPSRHLKSPLSPKLEAIIMRCLQKDPDARPADAAELDRLLGEIDDVGAWTQADARAWWNGHANLVAQDFSN